jgi:hypothetical protein
MYVFTGAHEGTPRPDFFNLAQYSFHLDEVSCANGTFRHNDETADKVVDDVLGTETQSDGNGTTQECKRCKRDIHHAKGKEKHQKISEVGKHFQDCGGRVLLQRALGQKTLANNSKKDLGEHNANNENHQGNGQLSDRDRVVVDNKNPVIPNVGQVS